MFRNIMNVIITPLGHVQTYNQGVSSVFVMTGINRRYNYNNNNSKNNKRYTKHECEKRFMTAGKHKGIWHIGGVDPFNLNL
jgi:hypothetical protein